MSMIFFLEQVELVAEKVGKSLREGDFVRVLVVPETPEWLVR